MAPRSSSGRSSTTPPNATSHAITPTGQQHQTPIARPLSAHPVRLTLPSRDPRVNRAAHDQFGSISLSPLVLALTPPSGETLLNPLRAPPWPTSRRGYAARTGLNEAADLGYGWRRMLRDASRVQAVSSTVERKLLRQDPEARSTRVGRARPAPYPTRITTPRSLPSVAGSAGSSRPRTRAATP
jgi:hypothetical protein